MQRLHYLEEQFRKVSGGLLLRLERPGGAGQGLLGDRAKDGSTAAFEMEMDRGRADSQRLGELAQAEPICADALDQLGGGGDDRSLRKSRSATPAGFGFSQRQCRRRASLRPRLRRSCDRAWTGRENRQREQHFGRAAGAGLRSLSGLEGGARQPHPLDGARMGAEGIARQRGRAGPCRHRRRDRGFPGRPAQRSSDDRKDPRPPHRRRRRHRRRGAVPLRRSRPPHHGTGADRRWGRGDVARFRREGAAGVFRGGVSDGSLSRLHRTGGARGPAAGLGERNEALDHLVEQCGLFEIEHGESSLPTKA